MEHHLLSSAYISLCLTIHQAGKGSFYTTPNLLAGSTPLPNSSENEMIIWFNHKTKLMQMIEILICIWH